MLMNSYFDFSNACIPSADSEVNLISFLDTQNCIVDDIVRSASVPQNLLHLRRVNSKWRVKADYLLAQLLQEKTDSAWCEEVEIDGLVE